MKIVFMRKKRSCFSWLIRALTVSQWSHVALLYDECPSDCILIEADSRNGVHRNLLSNYTDHPDYEIEIWNLKSTSNSIAHIKKYLFRPYGHWQILANLCARLLKSTRLMNRRNVVCSELVTRWLKGCEYAHEYEHMDPDYASPEDVYRAIKDKPYASRTYKR